MANVIVYIRIEDVCKLDSILWMNDETTVIPMFPKQNTGTIELELTLDEFLKILKNKNVE